MPGPAGPGALGYPSKGLKGDTREVSLGIISLQVAPAERSNVPALRAFSLVLQNHRAFGPGIGCTDPSGLIEIIERYCT